MISKPLLSFVVLALIIASESPSSATIAQTNRVSDDLRIENLELDRTELHLACLPGRRAKSSECNDNFAVYARATISGTKAQDTSLEPTVSGGRISNKTPNEFKWDLAGVTEGTYVLTVHAVDKSGKHLGSKATSLTVVECRDCVTGDYCPTISVVSRVEQVTAGETIKFAAEISGAPDSVTTYNWTVSNGSIVGGQGTPQIEVETSGDMAGSSVTAVVELSNPGWLMACSLSASETVAVHRSERPIARLADQFRTAGANCEEGFARMDAFFSELNNNPADAGVIIVYDDLDNPGSARRRKKQFTNFIKMRKYDPARITFLDATMVRDAKTQFWFVPPGAALPEVVPGSGPAAVTTFNRNRSNPYFFAGEYSDGIPGCGGNLYDLAEYAEALKAEAGSRGRVVISESSLLNYRKKRREILRELGTHGIRAARITIVYKHVRPMRLQESTELWIVSAPLTVKN